MVVREGEMNWQLGEVESALQREEEANNNNNKKNDNNNNNNNMHTLMSPSLGRQSSSIYSLTLDEFQHSLCESGKNFGSMNMDEFLSSIWNAEENQQASNNNNNNNSSNNNNNNNLSITQKGMITKQPSLPRQTSLSIPAPLCRKTVEQVWSEIHKEQQQQQHQNNDVVQNTESAPRQPTFGEMTLEDFLVKAGVVREQAAAMPVAPAPAAATASHRQQHYAVYPNNNSTMAPAPASFVIGGGGGGNVVAPPYQAVAQGGVAVGEPSGSGYVGNGKRDSAGAVYAPPPAGVCYGGRMVNGGGSGYGVAMGPTMGVGGPVSPVSSDGIGNENSGGQFGLDMSGLRGRKRMVDGPVERVVERRQRRMIKNRESAARSRARKQAYTVELEAELNQLREENSQLKQALAELERRRRQQCLEEVSIRVQTKAQKAKEKLRALKRNMSCPL